MIQKNPLATLSQTFHLDCPICLQQYNPTTRYPMILCMQQHSCCLQCTKKIIFSSSNRASCPVCKREIWQDNIARFRYLDDIRRTSEELKSEGARIANGDVNVVRKELEEERGKNLWLVRQCEQKDQKVIEKYFQALDLKDKLKQQQKITQNLADTLQKTQYKLQQHQYHQQKQVHEFKQQKQKLISHYERKIVDIEIQLERENFQRETDILNLKRDMGVAKGKIVDLGAEAGILKQRFDKIGESVGSIKEIFQSMLIYLQSQPQPQKQLCLHSHYSHLETQLQQLQQQFCTKQSQLLSINEQLNCRNIQLESRCRVLALENIEFRGKIQYMEGVVRDNSASCQLYQSQINKLTKNIQYQTKSLQNYISLNQSLQQKYLQACQNSQVLQASIHSLQSSYLSQLQEALKSHTATHKQTLGELHASRKLVHQLQAQQEINISNIGDLESRIKLYQKQLFRVEQVLSRRGAEIDAMGAVLTKQREKVGDLEFKAARLADDRDRLLVDIFVVQQNNVTRQWQLPEQCKKMDSLQYQNIKLHKQLCQLQQKCLFNEQQIQKNQQLSITINSLNAQIKRLKRIITAQTDQINSLQFGIKFMGVQGSNGDRMSAGMKKDKSIRNMVIEDGNLNTVYGTRQNQYQRIDRDLQPNPEQAVDSVFLISQLKSQIYNLKVVIANKDYQISCYQQKLQQILQQKQSQQCHISRLEKKLGILSSLLGQPLPCSLSTQQSQYQQYIHILTCQLNSLRLKIKQLTDQSQDVGNARYMRNSEIFRSRGGGKGKGRADGRREEVEMVINEWRPRIFEDRDDQSLVGELKEQSFCRSKSL